MFFRALALLLIAPSLAFAEAGPVFSDTGPDAAAYGKDENYPSGVTNPASRPQNLLVGRFSHFDETTRSRVVARPAQASPLRRADREIEVTYTYDKVSHNLADYLERHPATGLLILRGDTILYEHYRYARRDTDRLTSHSMAKTITGMLIGIAVAEGAIKSIDDPASAYVPELAGSEIGKTPIRALLHMASGIAFTETYDGTDDAAHLSRDLFNRRGPGPAAAVAQFNNRVAPPETLWHYAGLNTEALGLVLARATKTSVANYVETRIWQKIGAEANASWSIDSTGQEATFCCFNAVLRDWGRLGLLLANDGAWGATQVIPRQWVLDGTTAAPPGNFLAPGTVSLLYGYGYQTWLLRGPRRMFAFRGIHGQTLLVDPQSKLVLVHTAVRPNPSEDAKARELIALWRALVDQNP